LEYKPSEAVIKSAIDQGITFIDTANIYSAGQSEEYIGRALKGERERVILATKAGGEMRPGPNGRGNSRMHITSEVEACLKRLQTDYIDLFQIHFPDPTTPIEETLRTLDDLIRQGKIRYIGSSNFSAWQAAEAAGVSKQLGLNSFISVQPNYSLLNRDAERELVSFCQAYDMGIIPFFPLASGFLTGKYRRGEEPPEGTRLAGMQGPMRDRYLTERNFAILDVLESFAEGQGHTVAELAIAWLLAQPQVSTVIAGATKPEQIEANVKAADWHLTSDDLQELEDALKRAD
jgi:aryl-alcohol dehydrogenase-like predicted oxidoreductase